MAYTKQTWNCGDVISAEKLNHMEDGIEEAQNRIVFAHLTLTEQNTGTCDMNHDDIQALIESGTPVMMTWIYQPEGAPFVTSSGVSCVECNTGVLGATINSQYWYCLPNGGTTWTRSSN